MKDFLTKEEMKERLSNGEDPFDLTTEKWIRIRDICKFEGLTQAEVWKNCFASTCALCYVHRPYPGGPIFCSGSRKHGILPCPLLQIGECCTNKVRKIIRNQEHWVPSAWTTFTIWPIKATAETMIATLQRARFPYEEIAENVRERKSNNLR